MTRREGEIGCRIWVIADGYLPAGSHGPAPEMTSHETACIVNPTDREAELELMLYFADREPAGPYRASVPARRTLHLRFNELRDPEPVPVGTDYSAVIRSSVPVVIQHTRLDSRQRDLSLMSTVAFPADP